MHILVVDDEPMVRASIARMIVTLGERYHAYEAGDGEDALELLDVLPIDLIITDIRMPAIDGLQLAERVHRLHPHIRTVLLSGYAEFEYALSALHCGVHEYLLKPASRESLTELILRVEEELRQARDEKRIERQRAASVLQQRVQDLLYELPVPYVDLALFPPHCSTAVFALTADAGTLRKQSMRFAMKNVLEDMLRELGDPVVIAHDRLIAAILFARKEAGADDYRRCAEQTRDTLRRLFHFDARIEWCAGAGQLSEISLAYMDCLRKLGLDRWMDAAGAVEGGAPGGCLNRLVRTALEWMESEHADSISLSSIAERLFVNPNYLSTLFKSETGMTFTQHLTRIRMDRAKALLKDTHLKIYEICEKVGYTDQASFTKLFKATAGMTPFEYRENT
ncbi:response regulator transcription factor [Paenibacillus abyssi]|uniref:DNA-binding response regulator n=1 Tax=Paenibacillus abyssi TaxID=1340531 RepID=A0A917FWL6_9BACL|nr:response regulator [Paenibacillus abyssi]GGG07946.1 hypothetical protein GCM10010916_26020 [Paenibacillus abyssi]